MIRWTICPVHGWSQIPCHVPRVRLIHCTPSVLTPPISPNAGNSTKHLAYSPGSGHVAKSSDSKSPSEEEGFFWAHAPGSLLWQFEQFAMLLSMDNWPCYYAWNWAAILWRATTCSSVIGGWSIGTFLITPSWIAPRRPTHKEGLPGPSDHSHREP